jgi:anaerobic magnesium-protoporphyrin IX monomethyl ester cyclase
VKVFFIYPNSGSQVGFNYGVAHLAGVLKEAGHHTAFWQLCEEIAPLPGREEFIARLRAEAADLVAFSVVTNQWGYAQELARWAREAVTAPLVCGGVHALFSAAEILQTGLFDYVFRGECEEAFLEFVDRLGRGETVAEIRNLALVCDGAVRINPMRPLPDLGRLPPKDYDVMDFQKLIDAKQGWVGLMASRGCPFSCTYCFNHQMVMSYRRDLRCGFAALNYLRRFPVPQVMGEIALLLRSYRGIKMFIFDDDLFTYDKDYVREFCAAYRRTCNLPFVVNAHVGFFDAEVAAELAGANCRVVKFGVESGSARVRADVLNRHMTNERIVEAIRLVNERGMHSSVFIIIGFPHEGREDVWATIRLLAAARPGRFRWTYFFPYPGTRAHQISAEGSFINAEKMARLRNFTDDSCLEFGAEHNLFLRKVGRIMPWFVNACGTLPVADFYRAKVDEILGWDERQWRERAGDLHAEDQRVSQMFAAEGQSHYAVKYHPFMGVISDYFLQEK